MTTSTQELARRLAKLERGVRKLNTQPRLGNSSFEGSIVQYDPETGEVVQVIGAQPDGTNTVVRHNGPTPPRPTGLSLEPGPGVVYLTWDGTFEKDGKAVPAPLDFARLEIHLASNDPGMNTDTRIARRTIETPVGETVAVPIDAAGTQYVRAFTRTQSGVRSLDSEQVSVEAEWVFHVQPTTSPVLTVEGGIRGFHLSWPVTFNPSGYDVQIYVSSDAALAGAFVPSPANFVTDTTATYVYLETGVGGQPWDKDTLYWFRVVATNPSGSAAPSAAASARLRPIDSPDISVDAAWVGTMTVDRLRGGVMQADTVVGGEGGIYAQGTNGSRVGLWPDGFKVSGPDPLNPSVMKDYVYFPTTGAPNIITSGLQTDKIEIGDPNSPDLAMTLYGEGQLAAGSILRMTSGVREPITAPVITEEYQTLSVTGAPTGNFGAMVFDPDTDRYYILETTQRHLLWFDAATRLYGGYVDLNGKFPGCIPSKIAKVGSRWVLGGRSINNDGEWMMRVFDSSWNGTSPMTTIGNISAVGVDALALAVDPFDQNTVWGALYVTGGEIVFRRWSVSTGDFIFTGSVPTGQTWAGQARWGGIADLYVGAADYGNNRFVLAFKGERTGGSTGPLASTSWVRTYDMNGNNLNDSFPTNGVASLAWDGSNFVGFRANSLFEGTVFGGDTFAVTSSPNWGVWSAKADIDNGYQTALSPRYPITRTARKGYRITAPHQDTPDVQIYLDINGDQPRLLATLRDGATSFFSNGKTVRSSFTHSVSQFPSTDPAMITSSDGLTYWRANGRAQFDDTVLTGTLKAPGFLQAGIAPTGTMEADVGKTITVTFPVAFPTDAPLPVVTLSYELITLANPLSLAIIPGSITRSGFQYVARRNGTASVPVHWTAVAPRA